MWRRLLRQRPPEGELRTVAEGLAHPEKTLYCQVAALYNKVQDALQDYPAMQSLLKDYCHPGRF